MRKRGHLRKNWRTRFFQLYIESEEILYFASAAHKWNRNKAKGRIPLADGKLCKVPSKRFKKHNVFCVTTARGVDYYMEAPTENDRDAWMETIDYIIKGKGRLSGDSLDRLPEDIDSVAIVEATNIKSSAAASPSVSRTDDPFAGSVILSSTLSSALLPPPPDLPPGVSQFSDDDNDDDNNDNNNDNNNDDNSSTTVPVAAPAASDAARLGPGGRPGGSAPTPSSDAVSAADSAPAAAAAGALGPGGRPGGKSGRSAMQEYETIKIIGMGAFAKVILVRKRSTGAFFAMKVVPKSRLRSNKHLVETQKTERNVLARVDHPFIVRLHHAFQSKEKLYLVLDFINGGELFYWLNEEGAFSESRVQFYVAQMALAIGHLHSLGVLYRDLKPENVLLDASGYIRLTDFGISKQTSDAGSGRTSSFCGTPNYMAPEIIAGGMYGRSVDWWCLGILMFEMLVGRPPFMLDASDTNDVIFERIARAKRADVTVPFHVSDATQDFLYCILDVSPAHRLGSGKNDVADVLAHPFFAGLDIDAVLAKQLTPEFVPVVTSAEDLSNIDPEFVNRSLTADDTNCVSVAPGKGLHTFQGFTFVGEKTS
ncbi:AGC protein kinase [Thecamonas trahens ATCC 50062]|uniref:AGC protein kinase n=1 Tax=Thecamonas trahens ATCC 50062 TaxID=461836 RepID=A0A0L0DVC0_THETB|nr:AGC protein kinase [Thecamonas trahens ATCC 50062]KNC56254.1 AGC protein kinase [Thecamonas trahens ATCC 50062]|eukprot:XP_013760776.1 AGC protein kinase [Thecamonas trahens ATCC 50062]